MQLVLSGFLLWETVVSGFPSQTNYRQCTDSLMDLFICLFTLERGPGGLDISYKVQVNKLVEA